MKRILIFLSSFLSSFFIAFLLIHYAALPTLRAYPRLAQMIERFAYTEAVLIAFIGLALFLLIVQLTVGRLSTIYIYLVYSVYFFLLFVVLFTKAHRYQAISWDWLDFTRDGSRGWIEAVLNVVYFIPLGSLYGFRAKPAEFVFLALVTITGVETIQYVFYVGTFALSDILLNFLGCSIGYLLLKRVYPIFKE